MQTVLNEISLLFILPPILIGIGAGYTIGGQTSLEASYRIVMGAAVSIIGGVIVGLLLSAFFPSFEYSMFLAVLSFAGGCAFGEGANWAPTPSKGPKRHVVFDPEEEEAQFDREIEDAFKGSQ
ncbi:MAG: hypothetical protein ACFFEF_14045 [Candidatus Thorarchaeota archaeon]